MIKLDVYGFKQNLSEALEHVGYELSSVDMERFLALNFDEDSFLSEWSFSDFISFAMDIADEGIARACHMNDLEWSKYAFDDFEEYEEDEEDF